MRSAVTISLLPEARGGPFVFWDDLAAGFGAAARYGFDAVELFLPSANAVASESIRSLMKKHSLKLAAVGTGAGWVKHKLRLTDPDPSVREQALAFCDGMIEFAGGLGAPVIIGSMQGRWDGGPGSSERERALDWLADALQQLSERASIRGTAVLYEPLNRYETNLFTRVTDASVFLDSRGIQNVKLLADLFHMNIEEADIAMALRQIAPRLGHIHWADSNRQAVGFGHTDIVPIATTLRSIGYQGYLSAEVLPLPDSNAAAKQSVDSIRRWFPKS